MSESIAKRIERRVKHFLWPREGPDWVSVVNSRPPLPNPRMPAKRQAPEPAPPPDYEIPIAFPMFVRNLREPVPHWEPIEACPIPAPGRTHIHLIALTGRFERARMAVAYINDRGLWHYDPSGKHSVPFSPNWFGDAPYFPPVPGARKSHP